LNIKEKLLSLGKMARGSNGKPVLFSKLVDLIVIHWIGPYPAQAVTSPWNWWENGSDGQGVRASAHFIIKGGDVLQALPLNEVGWHSGDERNYRSIGIEVIPANTEGLFDDGTIETLKELIAHIRETYPDTKLVRHFDGAHKKDCPRWYTPHVDGGENRWLNLKNYLDGAEV